jgi:hypothetical protein
MQVIRCTSCGSVEFRERDGFSQCVYCQSTFGGRSNEASPKATIIGLASDIDSLLKRCEEDPANRQRYTRLILDLDPTNTEVLKYL